MSARYVLHGPGDSTQMLDLKGRAAWALEHLIAAGDQGCTPITTPGPRWAHYVYLLRRAGIDVTTVHEPHDGPFPGHHARYILRSRIERLDPEQHREAA